MWKISLRVIEKCTNLIKASWKIQKSGLRWQKNVRVWLDECLENIKEWFKGT